jgi:hypothetical protein
MADEELWARLEAWEPLVSSGHRVSRAGQDLLQAADRLKALTAEVAAYGRSLELKQALIEELKAEVEEAERRGMERAAGIASANRSAEDHCGNVGRAIAQTIRQAALEKQP